MMNSSANSTTSALDQLVGQDLCVREPSCDGTLDQLVGQDLSVRESSCDGTAVSSVTAGIFEIEESSYQLPLNRSSLYGRDKELALLESAYTRICGNGASEAVFVHGVSGTGKSSLVATLRNPTQIRDEESRFVYGKYDLLCQDEPFSAIVSAFTDICDLILQSDELDEMKDLLNEALGDDRNLMTSLIPNLSMLVSDGDDQSAANSEYNSPNSVQDLTRLRLVCRAFLRAVAMEKHPLIVVIDDIQWADAASVDVIKGLLTDIRSKNILIILAFRSIEVENDSCMQPLLQLQNASLTGEKCIAITEIHLDNLKIEAINMIVSQMIQSDDEATLPLSELVLLKTHGNAFFVLQYLYMLESQGLLTFSSERLQWEWDIAKIRSETMISDNVSELVWSKIQRLNKDLQATLKVAACLGCSF